MLTRDSSDTPPSASSSTNISQNISTDDASKAIDNTMRLPSHQNSVKLSTAPEAEVGAPSESGGIHSDYNEDSAPLGLQTTPAADSGPICDPTFNFHDTNIQIRTGNHLFRVHQFKLYEFDRLRPKLEQAPRDDKERKTIELLDNADDFHNLLTVLYSPVYNPHLFSSAILKSTLKLATKYAHPTLRTFSIKELEKHTLEPIERFELSRDCSVTEWMSKAIDDLCWREDPITVAEAQILGPERFVEVAARREGIQFERGSRVGLSGGHQIQSMGADPELTVASQPVSLDLGDILAASSTLLATTSNNIQPASREGPDLTMLVGNFVPDRSSFAQPGKSSTDLQPVAPVLAFARLRDKPLPFRLDDKSIQSRASAPSVSQPAGDFGTVGKGTAP